MRNKNSCFFHYLEFIDNKIFPNKNLFIYEKQVILELTRT